MKIRCLLVDDEPLALDVLRMHISNCNGLEIVATCKNAIEALDLLHEKNIDLIFLDIKMPKLLGTDFLKNLSNPPKVIFVTAHRDFALDGYELDVVDYLVKPVSFERFMKAVSKVKRLLGHTNNVLDVESGKNQEAFVYLKIDKSMQKITVKDILYIESLRDYVKIVLTTGNSFICRQSITSMVNLLSVHSFLRVHRSFIVSIDKVTGYNNTDILLGKLEIPIGRLYKQEVMNVINSG